MQCPKCKGVVWFGDKCAACGNRRDTTASQPEAKPAKPAADSSDES